MRILHLGLRPKPNTVHYPVIRTEICHYEFPRIWNLFTHMLFTSQTAVEYWPGPWDKEIIAIGPATALALEQKGYKPSVIRVATQEGMIEWIREIKGYFFIPRSNRARSLLTDYLEQAGKPFYALNLYETVFQTPEPIPNLDDFDEIQFTSPSTVEGFLRIFHTLPKDKKLTAIGPITEQVLNLNNLCRRC